MKSFRKFSVVLYPFLALVIIAVLVFLERSGVNYEVKQNTDGYLPQSYIENKKDAGEYEKECLILIDSNQSDYYLYKDHLTYVLDCMKVGYDIVDIAEYSLPDMTKYKTSVITFPDLDILGENVFALCDWVYSGGAVMFQCTINPTVVFKTIRSYMGIAEGGTEYVSTTTFKMLNNLMIGGQEYVYTWEEPSMTVLNVRLKSGAKVFAESDDRSRVPMLWSSDYGTGRFVVNNHGMCEKSTRGLTAVSYSLLQDVFAYPCLLYTSRCV